MCGQEFSPATTESAFSRALYSFSPTGKAATHVHESYANGCVETLFHQQHSSPKHKEELCQQLKPVNHPQLRISFRKARSDYLSEENGCHPEQRRPFKPSTLDLAPS
jgi:hypothetical protein